MHAPARRVEAVLFIAPRPVTTDELADACGLSPDQLAAALTELSECHAGDASGLDLVRVAGGYTLAVADECREAVERFAGARRPDDLTPALLETLSVVAYLQPTTRAEVAQVRGVSSEWALSSLVERGLVTETGRSEAPGNPILYATTSRFLELFGLASLDELPDFGEFALSGADVDEIRARLLANAERRRQ